MLTESLTNQPAFIRFLVENPLVLVLLTAWIITWKGIALWKAARVSHKWWFVILIVVNTFGILEIIYFYFVARKYTVLEEVEEEEKV